MSAGMRSRRQGVASMILRTKSALNSATIERTFSDLCVG